MIKIIILQLLVIDRVRRWEIVRAGEGWRRVSLGVAGLGGGIVVGMAHVRVEHWRWVRSRWLHSRHRNIG